MQVSNQVQDQVSGKFLPGKSANPAGRPSRAEKQARIDAKARELAAELGGWEKLTIVDRVRLEQCAALLVRRPTSAEDAVRCANAVDRLLGAVERRRGKLHETKPGAALDAHLAELAMQPPEPDEDDQPESAP